MTMGIFLLSTSKQSLTMPEYSPNGVATGKEEDDAYLLLVDTDLNQFL